MLKITKILTLLVGASLVLASCSSTKDATTSSNNAGYVMKGQFVKADDACEIRGYKVAGNKLGILYNKAKAEGGVNILEASVIKASIDENGQLIFNHELPEIATYYSVGCTGKYIDEKTGSVSARDITLTGFFSKESGIHNLNVFTTLATPKILADVNDALTSGETVDFDEITQEVGRAVLGAFLTRHAANQIKDVSLLNSINPSSAGDIALLATNFNVVNNPDLLVSMEDYIKTHPHYMIDSPLKIAVEMNPDILKDKMMITPLYNEDGSDVTEAVETKEAYSATLTKIKLARIKSDIDKANSLKADKIDTTELDTDTLGDLNSIKYKDASDGATFFDGDNNPLTVTINHGLVVLPSDTASVRVPSNLMWTSGTLYFAKAGTADWKEVSIANSTTLPVTTEAKTYIFVSGTTKPKGIASLGTLPDGFTAEGYLRLIVKTGTAGNQKPNLDLAKITFKLGNSQANLANLELSGDKITLHVGTGGNMINATIPYNAIKNPNLDKSYWLSYGQNGVTQVQQLQEDDASNSISINSEKVPEDGRIVGVCETEKTTLGFDDVGRTIKIYHPPTSADGKPCGTDTMIGSFTLKTDTDLPKENPIDTDTDEKGNPTVTGTPAVTGNPTCLAGKVGTQNSNLNLSLITFKLGNGQADPKCTGDGDNPEITIPVGAGGNMIKATIPNAAIKTPNTDKDYWLSYGLDGVTQVQKLQKDNDYNSISINSAKVHVAGLIVGVCETKKTTPSIDDDGRAIKISYPPTSADGKPCGSDTMIGSFTLKIDNPTVIGNPTCSVGKGGNQNANLNLSLITFKVGNGGTTNAINAHEDPAHPKMCTGANPEITIHLGANGKTILTTIPYAAIKTNPDKDYWVSYGPDGSIQGQQLKTDDTNDTISITSGNVPAAGLMVRVCEVEKSGHLSAATDGHPCGADSMVGSFLLKTTP